MITASFLTRTLGIDWRHGYRRFRELLADSDYVRRYVPELASLAAPSIHTPWKLPAARRRQLSYPDPLSA